MLVSSSNLARLRLRWSHIQYKYRTKILRAGSYIFFCQVQKFSQIHQLNSHEWYQILMGKNNVMNATKKAYLKFINFEAQLNSDHLALRNK